MMIVGLVIGALLLVGIIALNVKPPSRQSRDEHLQQFARLLHGRLEPIPGMERAFVIAFMFEGRRFTFEDIEEQGLSGTLRRGLLKTSLSKPFSLSFTEKQQRSTIRSDVSHATTSSAPSASDTPLQLPEALSEFSAYSNNNAAARQWLMDTKVVKILARYKNTGTRGCVSLPFRIAQGVITLEFSSHVQGRLNANVLYRDIAKIEEYLDELRALASRLELLLEES